jgi:predicted enzyme related to lactoylglutathione lyase
MTQPFVPGVGQILSADIAVPDHALEVQFYAQVLTTGSDPFWRTDLMNNLGLPIIGLGPRIEAHAALPLQWMPHIQVADVGASAERSEALGGRVLLHERDAKGRSQWAVLEDPAGAAFGIIPVVPAEAIPSLDPPLDPRGEDAGDAAADAATPRVGCIQWADLTVPDAPALRDFYARVIGWRVEDVRMQDDTGHYADYNMLAETGTPAAGVCHARGPNAGLPPAWLLYLPVGDLAESLRQVEAGGGEVLQTMKGKDDEVTYAAVRDPAGAAFALVQG